MRLNISLAADFSSAFGIGDNVLLNTGLNDTETVYKNCWVRCVIFTRGKVRYSLWVEMPNDTVTCYHNIDSVWLEKGPGPNRTFEFDNYS